MLDVSSVLTAAQLADIAEVARKARAEAANGPTSDDHGADGTEIPDDDFERVEREISTPAPLDILRPMMAPPLRVADVPGVLARFADAHARATGFDPSILIAGCLGAAAAMLSDEVRICVAPRSSWFESARIWLAVIGGSAVGKSPGLKAAQAPVYALHRELIGAWMTANKDVAEDERPPMPALYTSDSTTEALAELLRTSERGILYTTDELESWLSAHDAYRNGAGKDRGEWLRLYDGGPHQVHRIKRGAFFVPNWGASLLSATTPAALRKLSAKLPADGLLQRFLLVLAQPCELPDCTTFRADTRQAAEEWAAALRCLYAMPAGVVQLSGAARVAFDTEHAELHKLTMAFDDTHPALAAHYGKRTAMLARIALLFHALDGDVGSPVSGETMAMAVRWLRRQERHATAVYTEMLGADTGIALAKDIGRSILAGSVQAFNRRELTHRCKAFRDADDHARQAALGFLADCGWIVSDSAGYAHGAWWTVDARVHSLFAATAEAEKARRELVRQRMRGTDDDE